MASGRPGAKPAPHEIGLDAMRRLRGARLAAMQLAQWSVVDELTMTELLALEETLRYLHGDLQMTVNLLFQAQRKRAAQGTGSELRHEVERLRRDLDDCQRAKLSLTEEEG